MSELPVQHYVPAMGRAWLLPFYDVFSALLGAPAAHRHLLDVAGISAGQDVLEIGCGTGSLALLVKRHEPSCTVSGLDPDAAALARAVRKAARRRLDVRWDRGFAGELPYPDASVDRVLSSFMLHHLDEGEKQRTLRDARRVLRPGGQLHILDLAGSGHGGHSRFGSLVHASPAERIPELLEGAGFTGVVGTGTTRLRGHGGSCVTFRAVR